MESSARETQYSVFLALTLNKVNIFPFHKIINKEWLFKTLNFLRTELYLFLNHTIMNNLVTPWALNCREMF